VNKDRRLPVHIIPECCTLSVKLRVPAASSTVLFTADIMNCSCGGEGGTKDGSDGKSTLYGDKNCNGINMSPQ
jgi:hypothetical protein